VKIEDSPQPVRRRAHAPQLRKAFKNGDLPSGCQTNDTWRRAFIPTYLWWVATQEDPWALDDEKALDAMQDIWNTIYDKNVTHTITLNDPVFAIVSHSYLFVFIYYIFLQAQQRASDSWRSAIGSAALSIVNALFAANEEFGTNEARQEFAAEFIENLGFLYGNIDSKVSYMFSCTSRSSFLMFILAIPRPLPWGTCYRNIRSTLHRDSRRKKNSCSRGCQLYGESTGWCSRYGCGSGNFAFCALEPVY
jgi:hypothetical protein